MNDAEMRGATLYAKLMNRLFVHGGSITELANHSGLSYPTVQRYIKALRGTYAPVGASSRMHPLVRIIDWEIDRRGNPTIPVFRLDPGPDLKRPKRIGDAERQRRYRANVKRRAFVGAPSVFQLDAGKTDVLVGCERDREDQERGETQAQR